MTNSNRLQMYGGPWAGLIPLCILILGLSWLSFEERGGIKPFGACAWIALSFGLFFSRTKKDYCKSIVRGMANESAIVITSAWLFAGVLGKLMAAGGLVHGLLWLGMTSGATGSMFTVMVFLISMLFALGTGTSTGTCITLTPILYPSGFFLGADPTMLALAILSGSAFGDNLSPISDTTIVSAYTQDASMHDIVRSRCPLSLGAALLATIIFAFLGGGSEIGTPTEMQPDISPIGLIMLLALAIVVVMALFGRHIIEALIYANITAGLLGILIGYISPSQIFYIPIITNTSTGIIQNGIDSVTGIIIFAILIMAITNILVECGIMSIILDIVKQRIITSVRGAEFMIMIITIFFLFLLLQMPLLNFLLVKVLLNHLVKHSTFHHHVEQI